MFSMVKNTALASALSFFYCFGITLDGNERETVNLVSARITRRAKVCSSLLFVISSYFVVEVLINFETNKIRKYHQNLNFLKTSGR
jgi:hypothetical protein